MLSFGLGHLSLSLHGDLLSANLLDTGLRCEALSGQCQLTFVLKRCQSQLMALVGFVLEVL
jgi:hypothetical protein